MRNIVLGINLSVGAYIGWHLMSLIDQSTFVILDKVTRNL